MVRGAAVDVAASGLSEELLLSALDGYEGLPPDLVLAAPTDEEMVSLAVPSPREKSAQSEAHVPRSQRQKAERSSLMDQVTELERQLEGLRLERRGGVRTSAWKRMATRQRARRTVVEEENRRLRGKLRRLIQVARSLEAVMTHREQSAVGGSEDSVVVENDEWMDDLGQVFQRCLVEIQRAFEARDTVLPAVVAVTTETARAKWNRSVVKSCTRNGVDYLYVETRQLYVLPFSCNQVSTAVWKAFTTQFEEPNRILELYVRSNDVFSCKFRGDSDTMAATTFAKTYLVNDRTAVIWRGFIAPIDSTLRGAVASSTGWFVTRPMISVSGQAVVDVCIRTMPRRRDILALNLAGLIRLPTDPVEVGVFTTQKMCTSSEDMQAVVERIEDILLDEKVESGRHNREGPCVRERSRITLHNEPVAE